MVGDVQRSDIRIISKMVILICIFSFIIIVSIVHFTTLWIKLSPYNQGALEIKTFDGSDSPYHPSVLYFEENWNGYRYWMAETPFSPKCKPYEDRNECPSIHVSNDGIKWSEIAVNPIDDLNEKEIEELDYFSDPHLVFVDDRIECWYRFTHRNGIQDYYNNLQLVRKTSTDGINWSEREVMVELATEKGNALGNMVVSPAILYEDGKYRMWYINSESRIYRELSYSESEDGKEWRVQKKCILNGQENMPWHIDVNYINGKYYLISYDFKDLTFWHSDDGTTFNYADKLLEPSVTGSFYSYSLYRACIIKDKNLKIYFSANDSLKTYIGLLEEDATGFRLFSDRRHRSILGLADYIIATKWRTVKFLFKRLIKTLN